MLQDARCTVEISSDLLTARGSFFPAVGEGHLLKQADVDYELRGVGVSGSINWDLVNQCLERCNNNHEIIRDVVVARGTASRASVPACLVFHPSIQSLDLVFVPPEKKAAVQKAAAQILSEKVTAADTAGNKQAGSIDEQGNIDFREVHGLFIIHEGQLLAIERKEVGGIPGANVKGDYIGFSSLEYTPLSPGENVEIREGKAYATKNGRFAWNSHSFWIEETLELKEEVGYKTGNIRFPGNLVLKAGIKDRFKVWVGGNLLANTVLDAYEIFCGGNLEAKGGIIGRGKGLVRVRGALETRFAEHCDIEVLGDVRLELAALNSHIYTLGSLSTGDKGRLVGGHIQARGGIDAFTVGNHSEAHMVISVGENYVMHRKLEYSREKFQQIHIALQKVAERLAKGNEVSLQNQAKRLQEEGDKYQTTIVEVLNEINDNEDAALIIRGSIFPGVTVEICRVPFTINTELKAVKFTLDKATGKILVSPLAGPAAR